MTGVLKFLSLGFSALLPVVNPVGSALIFLSIVGLASPETFRSLARRVAISTALFLLVIDVCGAAILSFFGISLPVVQLAGGLVLGAMGWKLLNQEDAATSRNGSAQEGNAAASLASRVFYPLTFPVTVGPGSIVVMLTLSAHASKGTHAEEILAHAGIAAGIVLISVAVFLSYAYAETIAAKVSPQTAQGVLRVIAFVLLCIGAQIAWNGLEALIRGIART